MSCLQDVLTDKKEIKAYLKQVDKIKDDEEPIKTVGKKIAELDEKEKIN